MMLCSQKGQNPIVILSTTNRTRLAAGDTSKLRDGDVVEWLPGQLQFRFRFGSSHKPLSGHTHHSPESTHPKKSTSKARQLAHGNPAKSEEGGKDNYKSAIVSENGSNIGQGRKRRKQEEEDAAYARLLQVCLPHYSSPPPPPTARCQKQRFRTVY